MIRLLIGFAQALNPGNLKTPLLRHVPAWQMSLVSFFFHAPIYGAYTELFAGLSPEITIDKGGCWSTYPPSPPTNLTNQSPCSPAVGAHRVNPV